MQKDSNGTDDLDIVLDRKTDIKKIEQDVEDLAEIQQGIAKMIVQQGEPLNEVEGKIESSKKSTWDAAESILEAEKQTNTSRKRKFWLGLTVIGGFLTAAGVAFISSSGKSPSKE